MRSPKQWTIWIPVIGIIFYRLRIETETANEDVNFTIVWMLYWILHSLFVWSYIFLHYIK